MSIERTRYGTYRVRFKDGSGASRAKSFKTRKEAEHFNKTGQLRSPDRMVERHQELVDFTRLHAATADVSLDPRAFYVYFLWGSSPHKPIYVGSSTNIFGRLGDHFRDETRRDLIRRVTVTRCDSQREMLDLEAEMIAHYSPRLNIIGVRR